MMMMPLLGCGIWTTAFAGGPPLSFLTGVNGGERGGYVVADVLPCMPVAAADHLFFDFVIASLSLRILWVLLSAGKMGRIIANHQIISLQNH
jgi:hypothetical protein